VTVNAATRPALTLGSLRCTSPYLLAPLESVSDAPFRKLCHKLGAGLTFTEMIRAKGLAHQNKSTLALIDTVHPQVPTGLQLLATGEAELSLALSTLEKLANSTHPHFRNICAVDLNFGCPSPDVIRIGAGPALLKRRAKMQRLFEVLRDFKEATTLPIAAVGAKIRLGLHHLEQRQQVYLPVTELANQWLDYLTVHARHARQKSTEAADLDALREITQVARIPVIGNGDLFSLDNVNLMHQQTQCAGFLIARGAIRSPWIFRALTLGQPSLPTVAELESASSAYFAEAGALGSKDKFVRWHREGFERLAKRLQGDAAGAIAVPQNENL
jgi:tRNA-dihydrouridine synthase B